MSDLINLTINDRPVTVAAGTTVLKAAQELGEHIPTICAHDHCTANGVCRMCLVEIEGARVPAASCVTLAAEGMRVYTNSERLARSRRTILEMLSATVDLSEAPEILALVEEYQADGDRFPEAIPRRVPVLDDNPMFIRDYAKCVLCWRCVQVCADDAQYTYAIDFTGRGYATSIGTFFARPLPETSCVFCGQCIGVCPTGTLKPKREWLLEQGFSLDQLLQSTRMEKKRR